MTKATDRVKIAAARQAARAAKPKRTFDCRISWTSTTVTPAAFTGRMVGPKRMTCRVTCPDCGKTFNSTGHIDTNVASIPPHNRPRV